MDVERFIKSEEKIASDISQLRKIKKDISENVKKDNVKAAALMTALYSSLLHDVLCDVVQASPAGLAAVDIAALEDTASAVRAAVSFDPELEKRFRKQRSFLAAYT